MASNQTVDKAEYDMLQESFNSYMKMSEEYEVEMETELQNKEKKIKSLSCECANLLVANESERSKVKEARLELESIHEALESCIAELESKKRTIRKYENEVDDLENKLRQSDASNEFAQKELLNITNEKDDLVAQLEELKNQLSGSTSVDSPASFKSANTTVLNSTSDYDECMLSDDEASSASLDIDKANELIDELNIKNENLSDQVANLLMEKSNAELLRCEVLELSIELENARNEIEEMNIKNRDLTEVILSLKKELKEYDEEKLQYITSLDWHNEEKECVESLDERSAVSDKRLVDGIKNEMKNNNTDVNNMQLWDLNLDDVTRNFDKQEQNSLEMPSVESNELDDLLYNDVEDDDIDCNDVNEEENELKLETELDYLSEKYVEEIDNNENVTAELDDSEETAADNDDCYDLDSDEEDKKLVEMRIHELSDELYLAQESLIDKVQTIEMLNTQIESMKSVVSENEELKQTVASLEIKLEQANQSIFEIKSKNVELSTLVAQKNSHGNDNDEDNSSIDTKHIVKYANAESPDVLKGQLQKLCDMYSAEKKANRATSVKLQDICGNIKVICRVRPLLTAEKGTKMSVYPTSSTGLLFKDSKSGQMKSAVFDRVFGTDAAQHQIFKEIEPLALSVIDGYNAAIMCYGQTGSGKTHTMVGNLESGDWEAGIAYRTLEKLYDKIHQRTSAARVAEHVDCDSEDEFQASIKIGMVEIYNDEVVDLLNDDQYNERHLSASSRDVKRKNLTIRADSNGGMDIIGLQWVEPFDAHEALKIFSTGNKRRTTASTHLNSNSSRSHSVLMIDVTAKTTRMETVKDFETKVCKETKSRLYLVDLAGSERVKASGAAGRVLKEATKINSSLSALGDVMRALEKKATHVPIRNSKLTYLLSPALSSGSRTALCINISPSEKFNDESVNTIMFANRVKKISLGSPTKTESHAYRKSLQDELVELRNEFKHLQMQCISYEKQIEALKLSNGGKNSFDMQHLQNESPRSLTSWVSSGDSVSADSKNSDYGDKYQKSSSRAANATPSKKVQNLNLKAATQKRRSNQNPTMGYTTHQF